jgi:alkyl hydroperoxide reductase subunit AhpC
MAIEHHLFAIGLTENSELWDVNHPEAQTAFVLAETLRRSKDPLLTISIYEQRLMRQYEKVLKMLREVQAERKAQEAREQEKIYEVGMCHLVAGKEFHPAEFGFVCSSAEAEAIVKRKWTLEHANNAHTWNFDRESCGPALAFTA